MNDKLPGWIVIILTCYMSGAAFLIAWIVAGVLTTLGLAFLVLGLAWSIDASIILILYILSNKLTDWSQ